MSTSNSSNATSAFLGQPPNNLDDYHIVRGIFRYYGLHTANASLGYVPAYATPAEFTHGSKQPAIIAGMAIVIFVIIASTASRLALRTFKPNLHIGWDDWTVLLASCMAITYPIYQIIMITRGGGGLHTWDVTYTQFEVFWYYGTVSQLTYYVSVGLIKISITLFIRRLIDKSHARWMALTADIFLATLVVYILLAIFWSVFSCANRPLASFSIRYAGTLTTPAVCGNVFARAWAMSIIHVVQQVVLLASPIVILWTVRMNVHKKARLFTIWIAGAISVLGGLLRQTQSNREYASDMMWNYTGILVWTSVDLCMGLVTANLPVMDAFIFGSWVSSKTAYGAGAVVSGSAGKDLEYGKASRATTRAAASRSLAEQQGSKPRQEARG
ncbi:putative integral membrane protein [Diaporthe ampelina]|uniref:Putative integral membrane protein n=1 Tax=Diaporthe ampelina TaxID=1214573 RepID=A0A0G2F6X7_9PEZI|nr:putative integral membrane protein [Diaporthe ampelina]